MPSAESRKDANGRVVWKGVARVYGVPKRTKPGFDSKVKALNWAAEEEEKMKAEKTGVLILETLEQAFLRYRDEVAKLKRGGRWDVIRINMFLYGKKTKARLPLKTYMSNVTSKQLCEWRDIRLKEVNNASVRREMNLIGAIFTHAMKEWNMIEKDKNPMADVERPAGNPPRKVIHNVYQRDAILNALGYMDDAPVTTTRQEVAVIYLIALETSMRSAEIVNLTKERTFLEKRFVHLENTKNGEARDVPLSKRAVELLKKVWDKNDLLDENGEHRIFSMKDGTRDVYFREAKRIAQVEGITFHDSRATAMTRLAKKLVNPVMLAKVSGHKKVDNVMIYYRESPTEIADMIDS